MKDEAFGWLLAMIIRRAGPMVTTKASVTIITDATKNHAKEDVILHDATPSTKMHFRRNILVTIEQKHHFALIYIHEKS